MTIRLSLFSLLVFFSINISAQSPIDRASCNHGGFEGLHKTQPRQPVKLYHLGIKDPFIPVEEKITPRLHFKIDMKILLLSATGNPDIEPSFALAKNTLQSYGIPFDSFVLTKNGRRISTEPLGLINEDGSGKYYGIITSTGELAYQTTDKSWESSMSPGQWEELKKYEALFSVRRVSLYTFPNEELGMHSSDDGSDKDNFITVTNKAQRYSSGIVKEMKAPLDHTWIYHAKQRGNNNNLNIGVLLNFKNSAVAATSTKFADGRQQLHFFFDQSIYSLGSIVIAPLWVKWLTHNTFVGRSRIYLNPQVDDLFLATNIWDIKTQTTGTDAAHTYRINPDDLTNYVNFQKTFLRAETNNLNFKTEMAYNGLGVYENGSYSKDQLFLKSKEFAREFFWLGHTWSHSDLDKASYQDTVSEVLQNIETAQRLGVWGTSFFSMNALITPHISGLFNSQSLHAFVDQKVNYVVGDNSRPELVNQDNPNLGLYTTVENNGYDGVYIMPRHATEVFYNTTLPAEMVSEYNFFYRSYFGKNSTLEEILAREESRAVTALLNFNPAPWMFHQANLRKFKHKKEDESLLSLWLKQVVKGVRKYSTLPILNAKMNDLKDIFLQRESLSKCNFNGQIEIQNLNMVKINAKSSLPCAVPISGATSKGLWISQEIYGGETNIVVNMDGKSSRGIILSPMIPLD